MKNLSLTFLFLISYVISVAQIEIDTDAVDTTTIEERYVDYSDQLLLKVMNVVKKNDLEIINSNNKQSLKLSPLGITSLGFGFNYKWLGLAVAFGMPASEEQIKTYGNTKRFDFQMNIYSKKFVIDAFLQQYNGFYISNPKNLVLTWDSIDFPQRDSMETLSAGVSGYYIFNNKKLSYKAAYVRNAVQKKSAGSFLLGGYFNLDYAGFTEGASSHFIPDYFPLSVQDSFPINAYVSRSYGISFGYTYTFVFWKHFFVNLSLIPGLGGKDLTVVMKNGETIKERGGSARFIGRSALGYEHKYFLIGLTSYTSTGNFQFDHFNIKPSTSGVRFFIAKRFNLKKKK